ncbi:MAG: hypothetical protein JG775_714, partial [Defluviitaleaceae bacterium]|nr:hypothetical protein [Defluviitaleaceae bacterium]
ENRASYVEGNGMQMLFSDDSFDAVISNGPYILQLSQKKFALDF